VGDKPDSLFAEGIEITCQFSHLGDSNPGFDLTSGRASGRKNGVNCAWGDPKGFDSGERWLAGI
jgi:hypothetical protein